MRNIQSLLTLISGFTGIAGSLLLFYVRSESYYHFFFQHDKKVDKNKLNKMFNLGCILIVLAIIIICVGGLIQVFTTYP